jgi:hypothetical protein
MTINLTINNSTLDTISVAICDSFTLPGGIVISTSGTYTDTISTIGGCDSVVVVVLTVHKSSSSSISLTACNSYISPSGKIWTTSNTYLDTIINAEGCDSLMTINLTVNSVSAGTISVSGVTLTCPTTGVTYQWLDCGNGNSVITGETGQVYNPIANGNYTCEVTNATGCYDTSTCVAVNSVGLKTKSKTIEWNLFPNPAIDEVTLTFSGDYEKGNVKVFNSFGKLVYEGKVNESQTNLTLDVSQFANGMYTVVVVSGIKTANKKLIINR